MALHFLQHGESQGKHPGLAEDRMLSPKCSHMGSARNLSLPQTSAPPPLPHATQNHIPTGYPGSPGERDGSWSEAWRPDLSAWEFGDTVSKTNGLIFFWFVEQLRCFEGSLAQPHTQLEKPEHISMLLLSPPVIVSTPSCLCGLFLLEAFPVFSREVVNLPWAVAAS